METTGIIAAIEGLCRDYREFVGVSWDNDRENGN